MLTQSVRENLPCFTAKAKTTEKCCLAAPIRVVGRKQILGDLEFFNDCLRGIR